jgi:Mrp family chromosome partitioning ATPase
MGKIYEALEKAQRERERKEEKKPPLFVVSPGERPSGGFEVAAEDEMVALSRNIDALLEASPRKVIQFIGPQGGEGTSTVVRDFAMLSAARFGKSVLLLDADPQSPSQHLFFRLQPQFGWGEILRNKRTFRKAICRIGKTSLYVYPTPPGPASLPEALFSPGIKEFWDAAMEKFDLVLIDSAPASASPDGIALSCYVDGVVLVLEADKTRKPVAENLKNQILQNGGNLLGMVFNNRRYHIPEFVYKRL